MREELIAFVERRVGDRALAEDLVQDAFVKQLDRGDGRSTEIRESAIGWMKTVLRNAIIDRARRGAVQQKRLEAFAAELALDEPDGDRDRDVCKCVSGFAATLKPEYAQALQRVDVDGIAVKDYAAEAEITT